MKYFFKYRSSTFCVWEKLNVFDFCYFEAKKKKNRKRKRRKKKKKIPIISTACRISLT